MKAFPLRSATICEAAISAIQQSCGSFFLVYSTSKSLRLSIKEASVCTRTLQIYLLVNTYIKSYKIKEIFGKVFIADWPIKPKGCK